MKLFFSLWLICTSIFFFQTGFPGGGICLPAFTPHINNQPITVHYSVYNKNFPQTDCHFLLLNKCWNISYKIALKVLMWKSSDLLQLSFSIINLTFSFKSILLSMPVMLCCLAVILRAIKGFKTIIYKTIITPSKMFPRAQQNCGWTNPVAGVWCWFACNADN